MGLKVACILNYLCVKTIPYRSFNFLPVIDEQVRKLFYTKLSFENRKIIVFFFALKTI